MSNDAKTRRGLLATGAGTGLALALTACGALPESTPAEKRAVATGLPGGELASMNGALVVEYAQLSAYRALARSSLLSGGVEREIASYATIEAEHVAALRALVRRLGGRPTPPSPHPIPLGSREAALGRCQDLEEIAGGMWTWFAQRATGFEVRTATCSVMGVEVRQLNALRAALGRPVTATAPAPLSVPRAVARVDALAGR